MLFLYYIGQAKCNHYLDCLCLADIFIIEIKTKCFAVVTNPYSILQALLLDEDGLCYTTQLCYQEFCVQTLKCQ